MKPKKRPHPDLKVEWKQFTSEELRRAVSKGGRRQFRAATDGNVANYCELMKSGLWEEGTGDTLVWDVDGVLMDGQHRALAAADYQDGGGDPVWFLCVSGVGKNVKFLKDQGLKRTWMQHCKSAGIEYASPIGSAVRAALAPQRCASLGIEWSPLCSFQDSVIVVVENGRLKKSTSPTLFQLVTVYSKDKETFDRIGKLAGRWSSVGKFLDPGRTAVVAYLLEKEFGQKKVKEFFDRVIDGIGLRSGSPILALRNVLLKEATSIQRHSSLWRVAVILKGWIAWMRGDAVAQLRWSGGEDFPDYRSVPEDASTPE